MTQTEELRLECLKLAASHISYEPHNIETFIQWAQKIYDFVTEQPAQATSETAPLVVSREWLCDKLTEMLHEAETNRAAATTLMKHQIAVGQCAALQEVINLINPYKQ